MPLQEGQRRLGRCHKTPAELLCRLLGVLVRGLPRKTFVFAGGTAFSTHAWAVFAAARRNRLARVGHFYPGAALHKLPPRVRGKRRGWPQGKGEGLPTPEAVVKHISRQHICTVAWYGGARRVVAAAIGHGTPVQDRRGPSRGALGPCGRQKRHSPP